MPGKADAPGILVEGARSLGLGLHAGVLVSRAAFQVELPERILLPGEHREPVGDRIRHQPLVAHHAQAIEHDGDNVVSEFAGHSFAEMPAARAAAKKAWEMTGLGPKDISLVEPWVPFSPMEIMVMRALGYSRDYNRETTVSPSGGLVSRGHPAVPTGFYSLHEVVQQLRGEAGARQVKKKAETAIMQGYGANKGAALATILLKGMP